MGSPLQELVKDFHRARKIVQTKQISKFFKKHFYYRLSIPCDRFSSLHWNGTTLIEKRVKGTSNSGKWRDTKILSWKTELIALNFCS